MPHRLPLVVILDSSHDVTVPKVSRAILSTLLRQTEIPEHDIEKEFELCARRIHIATVDDLLGWIPVLEGLKCTILQQSVDEVPPILLLWDRFLSESRDISARKEVERQIAGLLDEFAGNVALVLTVTGEDATCGISKLESHKVERVRLERQGEKDYVAIVHGHRIPFALSAGGIQCG